jgi:hypothetical protein
VEAPTLGLYVIDLVFDVGLAADRVSGNTEESAYAWLDDHGLVCPEKMVFCPGNISPGYSYPESFGRARPDVVMPERDWEV